MPPTGWQSPRRRPDGPSGTVVRFIEQGTGREKSFDFASFALSDGMRSWLASVFAAVVGPGSRVTRATTASLIHGDLRQFAVFLERTAPDLTGPEQLKAAHIKAFRMSLVPESNRRTRMKALRRILRGDPILPAGARAELLDVPLAKAAVPEPVTAYTDVEIQQIMTALRSDIRRSRDRIRTARTLLAQVRSGDVDMQSPDGVLGGVLDHYDRHGDVLRLANGKPEQRLAACGGLRAVLPLLCPTAREVAAFAVLLTALTGENFSTVAAWPAIDHRPDGGIGDPSLALIEAVKARRGPDREHMVTALEDLPPVLAGVLASDTEEVRLFRSPLRIYLLLVELTEMSRRHGGHDRAFGFVVPNSAARWRSSPDSTALTRWCREHGFPGVPTAQPGGKPAINVRRLRQSVIEGGHRPVAHTRNTRDRYLQRSRAVAEDSRIVVGEALRGEVAKARQRQSIQIIEPAVVAAAGTDLAKAARQAGLAPEVLASMVAGQQDTVAAACTDDTNAPDAPPGQPCSASFLHCLDCGNARALPHHLPVQITLRDQLAALRPNLDPGVWRVRYEPRILQLDELISHYTAAEAEHARNKVTDSQRRMIADLINGRLDLR